MCFSPEVDIGTGVVVGAVGVETLRHVHRPQELPLASLPLLFGVHQLTEAFVWWDLRGEAPPTLGSAALWLYMAFAFVVLPMLAPLAVLLVEPDARRRRRIHGFALLGVFVALVYAGALVDGPVGATITGSALHYRTGLDYGGLVAALYMVATVGALLTSSHRWIAVFGRVNLVVLPVLILVSTAALTSLWCVWAAVTSVVIARHQRATVSLGAARRHASTVTSRAAVAAWLNRIHFGAR